MLVSPVTQVVSHRIRSIVAVMTYVLRFLGNTNVNTNQLIQHLLSTLSLSLFHQSLLSGVVCVSTVFSVLVDLEQINQLTNRIAQYISFFSFRVEFNLKLLPPDPKGIKLHPSQSLHFDTWMTLPSR